MNDPVQQWHGAWSNIHNLLNNAGSAEDLPGEEPEDEDAPAAPSTERLPAQGPTLL